MTDTIATLLAAHAKGKPLAATIEETYERIERHGDPALFITLRPREEALALAERLQAEGPEGKPLFGVPFVVKDNIDVAGLPTTAACPGFRLSAGKVGVRRRAARARRRRSSSARPTSTSSRPASSACARPTGRSAQRASRRSSFPADRARAPRPRSGRGSSPFRSAPTLRGRAARRRRSTESSG